MRAEVSTNLSIRLQLSYDTARLRLLSKLLLRQYLAYHSAHHMALHRCVLMKGGK